jgi:hypothetical protein
MPTRGDTLGDGCDTSRDLDMTAYVLAKPADSSSGQLCEGCGQVRHKCVMAVYDGC